MLAGDLTVVMTLISTRWAVALVRSSARFADPRVEYERVPQPCRLNCEDREALLRHRQQALAGIAISCPSVTGMAGPDG
jgi:hypothetical protein